MINMLFFDCNYNPQMKPGNAFGRVNLFVLL